MGRSISLPLLATLSISLTACASKTITPEEYSGFLHDYSQLTEKKLPSGKKVLTTESPTLNSLTAAPTAITSPAPSAMGMRFSLGPHMPLTTAKS